MVGLYSSYAPEPDSIGTNFSRGTYTCCFGNFGSCDFSVWVFAAPPPRCVLTSSSSTRRSVWSAPALATSVSCRARRSAWSGPAFFTSVSCWARRSARPVSALATSAPPRMRRSSSDTSSARRALVLDLRFLSVPSPLRRPVVFSRMRRRRVGPLGLPPRVRIWLRVRHVGPLCPFLHLRPRLFSTSDACAVPMFVSVIARSLGCDGDSLPVKS